MKNALNGVVYEDAFNPTLSFDFFFVAAVAAAAINSLLFYIPDIDFVF